MSDLLVSLRSYILKILAETDVYLVFDRYHDYSIKSDTRQERLSQFRRSHNLSSSSPLPAKEIAMKVTDTKKQLIEMAKDDLLKNIPNHLNKLIITAEAETPYQVHLGVQTIRNDLKSRQEEADVIIPYQVSEAIADGKKSVKVICEDTDVFVLLCHCYNIKNWNIDVYMTDFTEGKNIISINDTVKKHKPLIPELLSVHALSGCDTVPMYFGIGKKKALKVAATLKLSFLGEIDATEDQYLSESRKFIAACYSAKYESSSKNRYIQLL